MVLLGSKYWEVKEIKHKGRGIFAKKDIPPGRVIGDYIGKILRTRDVDFDKDKKNLYLMYYHDQASIYPDLEKTGIHLLNHSCTPNSYLYTYKGHTLAFTLRKIFAGEELTISYQLAPKSEFEKICTHKCRCESLNCCKTMHLSEERYKIWRIFQDAKIKKGKQGKIRYGKRLKLLTSYPKTISDNPIYDLFGNPNKSPISFSTKTYPSIKEMRKIIRKTGRIINFPSLNTKIFGVACNFVILFAFL